eukprot:1748750-Prymnesium_polylepis.1
MFGHPRPERPLLAAAAGDQLRHAAQYGGLHPPDWPHRPRGRQGHGALLFSPGERRGPLTQARQGARRPTRAPTRHKIPQP